MGWAERLATDDLVARLRQIEAERDAARARVAELEAQIASTPKPRRPREFWVDL